MKSVLTEIREWSGKVIAKVRLIVASGRFEEVLQKKLMIIKDSVLKRPTMKSRPEREFFNTGVAFFDLFF